MKWKIIIENYLYIYIFIYGAFFVKSATHKIFMLYMS